MNRKSKLNQDQWEKVLSVILLAAARDGGESSLMEDVEAVAKVKDNGSALTILIQKKIEGIIVWQMRSHYGSNMLANIYLSNH